MLIQNIDVFRTGEALVTSKPQGLDRFSVLGLALFTAGSPLRFSFKTTLVLCMYVTGTIMTHGFIKHSHVCTSSGGSAAPPLLARRRIQPRSSSHQALWFRTDVADNSSPGWISVGRRGMFSIQNQPCVPIRPEIYIKARLSY